MPRHVKHLQGESAAGLIVGQQRPTAAVRRETILTVLEHHDVYGGHNFDFNAETDPEWTLFCSDETFQTNQFYSYDGSGLLEYTYKTSPLGPLILGSVNLSWHNSGTFGLSEDPIEMFLHLGPAYEVFTQDPDFGGWTWELKRDYETTVTGLTTITLESWDGVGENQGITWTPGPEPAEAGFRATKICPGLSRTSGELRASPDNMILSRPRRHVNLD